MKKVFVLISVLMSLSMFMVSCGDKNGNGNKEKDDTTPPTITFLNSDTLFLDLGDEAAALSGVIANDDVDGDITRSIKLLTELGTIGYTKLEYEVFDAAKNKRTAERHAIVKSKMLAGTYEVEITPKSDSIPFETKYSYTILDQNTTELFVRGFHNIGGCDMKFTASGKGRLEIDATVDVIDPEGYTEISAVKGEVLYKENSAGEYSIVSMTYALIPKNTSSKNKEFTATCVKK